jgi:hypothetical protein
LNPKGQYTYHWEVPERAGPGPSDADSVVWLYHAHDHEGVDIYAGLIGTIIVTRRGGANPDGTPKDVDREFDVERVIEERLQRAREQRRWTNTATASQTRASRRFSSTFAS